MDDKDTTDCEQYEAEIKRLQADVVWWRDKFNTLFDEREAEYKRHRASPLASGGNIRILQVRVTEKMFKRINRYRKTKNLSVSAAARELVEAGFEAESLQVTPESASAERFQ